MDKRHIGYAVKLLNRRLDQVLSNIPAIRENNSLTGIQTWALNYLIRNDTRDVFQKDVEAELKIRRSTATELLKAMERGGLIRRIPRALGGGGFLLCISLTLHADAEY